mmetsp:Transcript_55803/g.126830  ORF Transcript_55803/g.126830 Transcript_55803/m.126830 type:complete len:220 (-) Transcript_55803:13-672(-)
MKSSSEVRPCSSLSSCSSTRSCRGVNAQPAMMRPFLSSWNSSSPVEPPALRLWKKLSKFLYPCGSSRKSISTAHADSCASVSTTVLPSVFLRAFCALDPRRRGMMLLTKRPMPLPRRPWSSGDPCAPPAPGPPGSGGIGGRFVWGPACCLGANMTADASWSPGRIIEPRRPPDWACWAARALALSRGLPRSEAGRPPPGGPPPPPPPPPTTRPPKPPPA